MAPGIDRTALLIHPDDHVAIATRDLAAGETLIIGGRDVTTLEPIARGHKVLVQPRESGDAVLRYGQIIGFASQAIRTGQHVHTHNLDFKAVERDYAFGEGVRRVALLPEEERSTFEGIVRADGRVATRNYIGILTTVNCSATAARLIADSFRSPGLLDDFPYVDGVMALTHSTGCAMAPDGDGLRLLRRTLDGYSQHPNFAGFIIIGLGCETNQVRELSEDWEGAYGMGVTAMNIQDEGGTTRTVRAGTEKILSMLDDANAVRRETVSAERIVLAAECGGSDAYSGVTANPALGAAMDLVVANGGTGVWGETPEIYGAEHLLTRRAATREVGERLVERIRWWEHYTEINGGSMDNNPSPGNKAGGLTTILEKSLGAVSKGGTTDLMAVYEFAERITESGMVFMDTPGYDPVSVTGMVAGGANVVAFTTGRGSAFGCKPVPSLKLATNTEMFERMSEDMDINCGIVIDGEVDIPEMGRRIFNLILRTASGQPTKSEDLGVGDLEFVPWQLGAVM